MKKYVLAVLQHPALGGLGVSLQEAREAPMAPFVLATLNRTSREYRLVGVVPVKSASHGEEVLEALSAHALPEAGMHYRVSLRQVRAAAQPSALRRLHRFLAAKRLPGPKAHAEAGLSDDEKRRMAFDAWAYATIFRARLPFILLALVIAPVVAVSPWHLFYVGNVGLSGQLWHAATSVVIGVVVFYAVAFSASRTMIDELRQALREEAKFRR